MRRVLLTLALCLLLVPVPEARLPFAIAVVQTASGSGDEVAVTFSGAWGASNHVVAVVANNNDSSVTSITGVSTSITTLLVNTDVGVLGISAWCWPGDGSDTSFTASTTGGGVARVVAVEVSGAGCDVDGTPGSNADSTTPYNLSPLYTTTVDGALILGMAHSTSASDYAADTGTTAIPSDETDIGGVSLGGYRIAGAAGTYDLPFTSAVNETSILAAAAVKPAAAGATAPRGLLTLGIGGTQ